ncbi:MAG: TetR/AcrR family transcriptional regulator [Myxococcales bacterium]|nr:TetR/AcrR family transcriptional regulator [Myxococcales bacterium]
MQKKELAAEVAGHVHGRVPRELRRRQLLAEADELFTEHGYRAASMDELARRMGVSKPVVYDLAGSKERLFRDVMAEVHDELAACLVAAAAAEPDLARKVRAGILAFLRFVERRRKGWAALAALETGPAGADLAALRRGQAHVVARLLGAVAGRGGTSEPRALELCAVAIIGAVEAAALSWQAHPELSAEDVATQLADFLAPGILSLSRDPGRRLASDSPAVGARRTVGKPRRSTAGARAAAGRRSTRSSR